MAGNKFKEIPEEKLQEPEVIDETAEAEEAQESEGKKEAKTIKPKRKKSFLQLIKLDIADKNRIVHAMPFILFMTVIAMLYITNSFYAERTIRDIDKAKKDLKEKRAEFIATKSKLMQNSMQSRVAEHAEEAAIGVKESTVPPIKIVVDAEKQN